MSLNDKRWQILMEHLPHRCSCDHVVITGIQEPHLLSWIPLQRRHRLPQRVAQKLYCVEPESGSQEYCTCPSGCIKIQHQHNNICSPRFFLRRGKQRCHHNEEGRALGQFNMCLILTVALTGSDWLIKS